MNRIIYIVLILFQLIVPVHGQSDDLNFTSKPYSGPLASSITEKIHLHIDRPAYLAGETLWFKVNIVDSENHHPLDLSKVVYFEIIDNKNTALVQAKIAISEGFGNGAVYLPLSLRSGNYTVRAYTNWMKNLGPDSFFEDEIQIINTFHKLESTSEKDSAFLEVQFFPEGGPLVEGLRSKIAFRVIDQSGKGTEFHGAIIEDEGDTIALFKPAKFGIGYFYYTPKENATVRIIIKTKEDSISTALPEIKKSGYVMQVIDSTENQIFVSVSSNLNIRENILLYISASNGNKIIKRSMTDGEKVVFSINKAELGEGVSRLTIFDSNNNPVGERLYFKYPTERLNIEAKTNKDAFVTREEVRVSVSSPVSGSNDGISTNLSLAVYQLDSLNANQNNNIFNYLWLSSELKGKIESPDFYFENINDQTISAMDNLMLTHGWRNFSGDNVGGNKEVVNIYIPEREGLTIMAKAGSSNNSPNNFPFYLSAPGEMSHLYGSRSDDEGNLYFVTKSLYGKHKIIIQSNNNKYFNITLEEPFLKTFSSKKSSFLSLSPSWNEILEARHVHMQIQNIYWSEEKNTFKAIDSTAFYDRIDKTYLLDNYTRFPTMEEVMREYIPEVLVRKQDKNFVFRVLRAPHEIHGDNPLVLINNVPVFDINKIIEYNPLNIKQIDIIKDGYFLEGGISLRGIINYKTYNNLLEDVNLAPEVTILDFEGLQIPREFYSPMYGDDVNIESSKPDFRNLLYWEPTIFLKDKDTREVTFYTSDLSGKYIGIVQGLNEEGVIGSTSFIFEVKNEKLVKN